MADNWDGFDDNDGKFSAAGGQNGGGGGGGGARLKDDRDYYDDGDDRGEYEEGDEYEDEYNDVEPAQPPPARGNIGGGGFGNDDGGSQPSVGSRGGGSAASGGPAPPQQQQQRRNSKDPFENVEGARRRHSHDPFDGTGGSGGGLGDTSRSGGSSQQSRGSRPQGGQGQGQRPPQNRQSQQGGPPGRQGGQRPPSQRRPGPPGGPSQRGPQGPGGPRQSQRQQGPGGPRQSQQNGGGGLPRRGPPGQGGGPNGQQRRSNRGPPPPQGQGQRQRSQGPGAHSQRGGPPPGGSSQRKPGAGAPGGNGKGGPQRQRSEKNPHFQDVEKTGQWGSSLSKYEKIGIVAVMLTVVAVILIVVFVVVKPGQTETAPIAREPTTSPPTAAPAPVVSREERGYELIRKASPQVEWPGDPLTLLDMISSGGSFAFPQYLAAEFVLYKDPAEVDPENVWFLQRYGLYNLWLALGGDKSLGAPGWVEEWDWTGGGGGGANVCASFHGVECDLATNYVTKLNLGKNGLSTTNPGNLGGGEGIPYELSTLIGVTTVEFDGNDIGGPIPVRAMLDMGNLTTATFKSNRLTGTIPSSLAQSKVTFLSLDENELDGDVPIEMCDWADIEKYPKQEFRKTIIVNCNRNFCGCCRGPFCE